MKKKQRFLDTVWNEDGRNCRDMIIDCVYFFSNGNENDMVALIKAAAKSGEAAHSGESIAKGYGMKFTI